MVQQIGIELRSVGRFVGVFHLHIQHHFTPVEVAGHQIADFKFFVLQRTWKADIEVQHFGIQGFHLNANAQVLVFNGGGSKAGHGFNHLLGAIDFCAIKR